MLKKNKKPISTFFDFRHFDFLVVHHRHHQEWFHFPLILEKIHEDSRCSFYDFVFPFNPCEGFNQLAGSGIKMTCMDYGFPQIVEVRHQGFLMGNVVDMFQFNVFWPNWVPYLISISE